MTIKVNKSFTHIFVRFHNLIVIKSHLDEISDGEISNCSSFEHNPNDVTVIATETLMQKRKRVNKKRDLQLSSEKIQASPRKKRVAKPNTLSHVAYTVAKVMATWDDASEYGISFRRLNKEEQEAEVDRLNKVTKKGHKDIVKQKIIDVKFKTMVTDKMRAYLTESRTPLDTVYHSAPLIDRARLINPSFLSVGEWVEVDGDITSGWNSEGGIAVIIKVQDSLADVKYVVPTSYFMYDIK